MSNDPKTNPVITVADPAPETAVVEKQPNVLVRGFRKVKENPKTAIAVAGGALLLTGAAFVGRKTAPSHDIVLELEPVEETDEVYILAPSDQVVTD